MRKPACALSPSSWTSSSSAAFSSTAASTSSTGTCYAPLSWTPRQQHIKKGKRSKCTRAKNAGAGGAIAVPRTNSSIYRGVTRHKATGKFEAHLWDKHYSWNSTSTSEKKKGKQVYLGAYENQEAAARTYDLAALKYWGSRSVLNFPLESYNQERVTMQRMTREGYLATLRRRSSGFSRGVSQYRGVSKHHHNGRWEARIGHGHAGCKKYSYLGTFGSQEEAAMAYDIAALEHRGRSAVTNFDISSYLQPPGPKAQPRSVVLQPKDEPMAEAPQPTPLLQPKPEPEDEHGDPVALPLLDGHVVDHDIAEILPALCMYPADFEAMYPAPAPVCLQTDDLQGLSLPDTVRFEDDIEALFDAVPDDEADAVAATTISSQASRRWP